MSDDDLWDLLQDCWHKNPELRPTAGQIVERLAGPLIQATTIQSTTDWDETFSSKFRNSVEARPLWDTQIEPTAIWGSSSSYETDNTALRWMAFLLRIFMKYV